MNELEQLAGTGNYESYLKRMTASVSQSSKGLIPFFAATMAGRPGFRILDVGCGSGILMKAIRDVCPEAEIRGVDLNEYSVRFCREAGFDVIHGTLHDAVAAGEVFDCILFSSVLHEISSYDEAEPYSLNPVKAALADAYAGLAPGGKLLVRDGVRCDSEAPVTIRLKDPADVKWAERFAAEYRADPVSYRAAGEGILEMSACTAKEFLYTYTWGPESWPREVKERFGMASVEEWRELLRSAGFRITLQMASAEEYLKYLERKIFVTDGIARLFEQATALFIAEKSSQLPAASSQ